MPFTFSHPAIILPFSYLWEKRFSTTALIVGSVVPDFEYFIRFHNASHHSHTWGGIFWFDVAAGIVLCCVFHDIVKTPLIMNLPGFLHRRFAVFLSFDWKKYFIRHWVVVLYSLVLGVVSHLLWDKFTHQSYSFFNTDPALENSMDPGFHANWLYRIIQISYSLFGLVVIFLAVLKLPEDHSLRYEIRSLPYWALFAFLAVSILGIVILANGFEYMDWITSVVSCLLISVTLSSFLQLKDKWVLVKGWRQS